MIAHIRKTDKKEQTVKQHCLETSMLCAEYASSIGAESIGKIQGLLHDIGKLTSRFERYIKGNTPEMRRGEIDHSYAGARRVVEIAGGMNNKGIEDVARLIAHTIISHHGLHNWLDSDNRDYMSLRIAKDEGYKEILSAAEEIVSQNELRDLLENAEKEYDEISTKLKVLSSKKKSAYAFYLGMLERILQSCLIDADRTNTEDFMSDSSTENRFDTQHIWLDMERKIQQKCDKFSMLTDPVSKQRCDISERCGSFAHHKVGACRLIVPTGGGKTLSSLRFAIEHCKEYRKKRIIYIAPFMSILEQNSDELRAIAGEDCFTEHHSNLLAELDGPEELEEYELRTEKWDNPVLATTMVQFLNTLFSVKSSCVRRMHRLCDAVIIIDEIQSLPLKCVYMFNLAVNFLTHICGASVVLCSATQPVTDKLKYPMLLDEEDSMTGSTTNDFKVFHRTELISEISPYGMTYEEVAEFSYEKFKNQGNVLLIVNTKASAKTIFLMLREKCPESIIIHLSTNLCPQHRREKICEMKEHLKRGDPLICVTTQLIEAGVDISFRCVVRSLAGLDSVAQAAGRCNRNGESKTPCPVYLIKLKDESVGRLEGLQTAQKITQQIVQSGQYTDYLAVETQADYFRELYRQNEKKLYYPVRFEGLDTDLLGLLSLNEDHFMMSGLGNDRQFSVQAFKTAGDLFEVIDSKTQDVIVPFDDEARAVIEELDTNVSLLRCKELLRKAQRYTVSIYDSQGKALKNCGALRLLKAGVFALEDMFYDSEYGIVLKGNEQEVLMI